MPKKIYYTELDIFDQRVEGVSPKDYCKILEKMSAEFFWQNVQLRRDYALYIVNNLFSVFNYRFLHLEEHQGFNKWNNSILLKYVEEDSKFGVINYYFIYRDLETLCVYWVTTLTGGYGFEINSGGVFYLHGSEDNENVSGFLMRLGDYPDYDFFYIPKTVGDDIHYVNIEDYLDIFQTDIEHRLDN